MMMVMVIPMVVVVVVMMMMVVVVVIPAPPPIIVMMMVVVMMMMVIVTAVAPILRQLRQPRRLLALCFLARDRISGPEFRDSIRNRLQQLRISVGARQRLRWRRGLGRRNEGSDSERPGQAGSFLIHAPSNPARFAKDKARQLEARL
jgi:hypothetical protein